MKNFYVYIVTNNLRTLYIGSQIISEEEFTNTKSKLIEGFTKKYNIHKLVYFEVFNNPDEAIRREKQLKGWWRKKKIALIKSTNPEWKDLSEEF